MCHIKQINMRYAIILATEISNIDFSQVLETSENTLRYSNDNGKALLKFGANTIFQKGKDKFYGTIDLLKSKID